MNLFKRWDHSLRIKHLFLDADSLPSADETIGIAANVVEAIQKLQARLSPADPLLHDLDNCIEEFEALEGIENSYEARDRFNAALAELYDEADRGKRVWIA